MSELPLGACNYVLLAGRGHFWPGAKNLWFNLDKVSFLIMCVVYVLCLQLRSVFAHVKRVVSIDIRNFLVLISLFPILILLWVTRKPARLDGDGRDTYYSFLCGSLLFLFRDFREVPIFCELHYKYKFFKKIWRCNQCNTF